MSPESSEKVLCIRMSEVGDVLSIGVPALRYLQKRYNTQDVHFLTFDKGEEVIKLASPQTPVMTMAKDQWPDNIFMAMEAFLGLAEQIIGEGYSKIINLDVSFMPCFLARFLKDAGEPVEGNMLNQSVQHLLDELQAQTLQAEYVNDSAAYLQSTYFGMHRWHTPWWEGASAPEQGYPEFFLRHCCGFSDLELDFTIQLTGNRHDNGRPKANKHSEHRIVTFSEGMLQYPHSAELQKGLKNSGITVLHLSESDSVKQQLVSLSKSDLLVGLPGAEQWYATSVGCPSLILCGDIDPRILMPDYGTAQFEVPEVQDLLESIQSIVNGECDES